jgi:hypothetical protein
MTQSARRLSLHPLKDDEALAALIMVKPEGKKPRHKPTGPRRASKKKRKRK